MPELRQNLATKEWVVIATERALRPEQLKNERSSRSLPPFDRDCPFCPGNEKMSEAVYVHGDPSKWKVRVVRNKYPALVADAPRAEPKGNLYRRLPGEGTHEVIVESPSHNQSLAELSHDQARDVLAVYQERFRATSENPKVNLTLLFKNHGQGAGTTLDHPHAQLIGSSVVPAHVRHRMDEAEKYFEQNAECVICRMNEEEKAQGERLVAETPYFIAYVLYAALSPFHLWIVPKRHTAGFAQMSAAEADDLAAVLQTVLKKLHRGLGNPDYNFVIQSTPQDRGTTDPFHWYLSLVVRSGRPAGFELGSGMHLNSVSPEESARFLNSVKA